MNEILSYVCQMKYDKNSDSNYFNHLVTYNVIPNLIVTYISSYQNSLLPIQSLMQQTNNSNNEDS